MKCIRCKSSRIGMRLNGQRFCRRCGQRWTASGLIIRSFDKREFGRTEQAKPAKKEEQLPLEIIYKG